MNERHFRTFAIGVQATILGLEILLGLLCAWLAGIALRDQRWVLLALDLWMASVWVRGFWTHAQEINRHGLLGKSPWPRDQEDED